MPEYGQATSVVIIDDHAAFADSLAIALGAEPDVACVGVATTVKRGVELVIDTHPHVVLMDVYLPGTDGIRGTREVLAARPGTHVIILTGRAEIDLLAKAAAAGAAGFIPKEATFAEVAQAVQDVRAGHMLVPPELLRLLLAARAGGARPRRGSHVVDLTPREREVLALLSEATDLATIASMLGLSIHTCRGHVKNLLAKLGAHSQLEGVLIAARLGLIVLPDAGSEA